jgi:hypothetical protein
MQVAIRAGHWDSSAGANLKGQENLVERRAAQQAAASRNQLGVHLRTTLSQMAIQLNHALGHDMRAFQLFHVTAAAIDADLLVEIPIEIQPRRW